MLPLTDIAVGQEHMWLLEQLDRGSSAQHIVLAWGLTGPVDDVLLAAALRMVAARHEPMRTGFRESAGIPKAQLHAVADIEITIADVTSLPEAIESASRYAERPFDLAAAGLVRAGIYRVSATSRLLVLVTHHIMSDGWSAGVITREWGEAYSALRAGEQWTPPKLTTTYTDWTAANRAARAQGRWNADVEFWREAMDGAPPALEMPFDRQRVRTRTHTCHVATDELTDELLAGVRRLAAQSRASTSMILLATWAALLHRHSGQSDLVIGVPVSGRDRPELTGLVGLLFNIVPTRVQIEPGMSAAALIHQVRARLTEALAHRHVPFAHLVAELRPERNPTYQPIFQVLFNHGAGAPAPAIAGASAMPVTLPARPGGAELELVAVDAPQGNAVRLALKADADLFDAGTASLLRDHFRGLLVSVITDPATPIAEVALASPAETARLMRTSQPVQVPRPAATSVLDLVEAQVKRTPEAIAVTSRSRSYSYLELDRMAARLAHELRNAGVGPGSVVAIFLDRSVEALLGMMAAWKVGAAFLPVDPAYPQRRVEFILQDAEAALLLTAERHLAAVPDLDLPILTVAEALTGAVDAAIGFPREAEPALAYLIYTSGSTGDPKGVRAPHSGVINFLAAMLTTPGLESDDVVLWLTSPSFDPVILELFGSLSVGARIVVADGDVATDPGRLAELVAAEAVTVVQATPVTWRHLLDSLAPGTRLRRALVGGEALTRRLANEMCAVTDECWNMYGPTETTVWSFCKRVEPASAVTPVTIGRPIPNIVAWVLDGAGNPQPAGVVGELHIGGAGLAPGYHRRDALTAEKFVDTPLGRLYRSGDLVRLRHDGDFEFLGRSDGQIKLHGHRIELDEIANVLRRHPRVRDTVVVTRSDGGGDYIAAYVVIDR